MTSHPDSLDIDIPGLASQFIGGKWRERNPAFVDVVSPTTEEVLAQVAEPTTEDAEAAVVAAREAFDNGPWPGMPVVDRVSACRRLCDLLEARMDQLNRAW
ncbi:MAG: aldehyde dehydrogenase family protein, partial [Gammaproteobacteria bacterium]|nr:aldehyde dehydrogenase family protein [Gammaproteobacteria bacterium]